MQTKFSKGPWIRGKDGEVLDFEGKKVSVKGLRVSILMASEDQSAQEEIANANLMMAAYGLYQALAKAGDSLEIFFKHTGINLGDMGREPFTDELLVEIDAALAKARGEV